MSTNIDEVLESASRRDVQTVDATGKPTTAMIEGVNIREAVLHTDDRGTICEMYDPRWNWHPEPMVFTYFFTIRPGMTKGWGMHKVHQDRYFLVKGEMKLVMYDSRPESSTFGLVREIYLSEHRRQLVNVPEGVWHADENIGKDDVLVVNFPTIQYDHTNPDKYRLPLDTDLIPYKFPHARGY